MQWGSENNKNNLQTGVQNDVSKLRPAYTFQYIETKIFSTLLLGVPSVKSPKSFTVSQLAPKKTVMYTKKCKWLLHKAQLPPLRATNIPHSYLLHCHVPCFPFILYAQLTVTLKLVLFSTLLVTHIIRFCPTNKPTPFLLPLRHPALKSTQLVKSPAESGKAWRQWYLQHLTKSSVPPGLSSLLRKSYHR